MRKFLIIPFIILFSACTTQTTILPTPSLPAVPSGSPVNTTTTSNYHISGGFIKRDLGKTGNLVESQKYPTEVTSIADADLTGFRCTPYLYYDPDKGGYGYFNETTNEHVPFKDPIAEGLISKARDAHKGTYEDGFTFCETEAGKFYVITGTAQTGGGIGYTTYISQADPESGHIEAITKIPAEAQVYFGCRKVVQFTKDSIYLNCGGGDGPGGSVSLYKVNLETVKVTRIIRCDYMANDTDNKVKVTCTK